MAVTAQAGIFSWGAQAAKGTISSTFYQHRAADIDLGTVSDDRLGPPEVGGIPTPTFPYRAGVMSAGGATINPRLENTFGWLLHGAAGAASCATDKNVFDTTSTGFNHHTFKFSTVAGFVPWMSFRKYIPGAVSTEYLGESFVDCKIVSMALAMPNDGPITARVDVLGRTSSFDDNPSWTYGNTEFEDYQSIPVASVVNGYIKIPDFSADALPITQATVTLANQPLDIRQEKVFGSPYLEDVTIIGRQLTVDMIVKWTDPEFYLKVLTGSTTGTNWTAAPFVQDLDIYSLSTGMAVSSYPWQFRVQAEEVMYQVVGGIRLAGNGALMMRVQGTAIAPSTGDYFSFHLGNTAVATAYSWPT